jgi:hypothetical protein
MESVLQLIFYYSRASFYFLKHLNIFFVKEVAAFLVTQTSNGYNFHNNEDIWMLQTKS